MNLMDIFKDKLENLVVPEASADPGPGEVEETGHYDELAEDQEPFSDDLGVEETRDAKEEPVVDSDEVKLATKTVSINLMLLRVSQYICQRRT